MASFVNIMNNGLLRANLPPAVERRRYGITAYNHPLNLTKEQLTEMALYVISFIINSHSIFELLWLDRMQPDVI